MIRNSTHWPTKRLGNLCDIQIGNTPPRANDSYWGEGMPWLSIADMAQGKDLVSTKESITQTAIDKRHCKLVPPGTLLMSFKLSVGKLGFARTPMYTNEAIAAISPKEKVNLLPDFLYHALSVIDLLGGTDRAVMGATLNKKKLAELEIPLPPLPEQRRIAAILDKADAIRRKRQQAIRLTAEFLRSVFLDMFGDPVTNPKGWEVVPLGEITCIDAPMVDPREEQYQDLLHIGPDRIEKATGRLFPAKTAKEDTLISGKFLFDERYVLYSKIRPLLRKVALPNFSALCSADIYPVRPNTEVMTKEFLWYVLLSDSFLNYTQTLSSRANIPKINRKEFSAYLCYLPPLSLQEEFSEQLQAIKDVSSKLEINQGKTENLFNSLVQRAFRGDL